MNDKLKKCLSALLVSGGLLGAQQLSAATVQVTTHISAQTTWRATNTYLLNGFIYVLDGASLTIDPGTVIKGKPGQDANTSALIVTRGGKIFAEGTRAKPIIFTAEADDVNDPEDLPVFQRGLWGGIVILGKTTLNTTVDVTGNAATPKYEVFEGLPDSQINGQNVNRFGGNDDNDSSGVFRYVSIRHAGVVFQPNKELNGLSLGAVGRGTTIEYVEAYATADDGFEFFGGTVNTKYLVSSFNDDDAFDIDQGYRVKNQFWFAIQEPGKKDNGGEWNGEPNGVSVGANPIANFEVYNATWIGAGTNVTGNRGLLIREYAAPKVYNSILSGFGTTAVSIDNKSAIHLTNGVLDIRDNIFWNFGGALGENGPAQLLFSDTTRSNLNVDPQFQSVSRTANGRLDPRPKSGSAALQNVRSVPANGFYQDVNFKGAFGSSDLWINDWTALASLGFVSAKATRNIQVTTHISGNTTWFRTNAYVLNGFIYVLDGASLTIEPGTVIKGKPGLDANTSALIVTRGGKIFAEGTPQNPIIFTAEADDINDPEDLPVFQRGLWGGIVILGKTTLNTTVDVAGNAASPKYEVFEGLPDTQINGQNVNRFGGNDDNDSSGVFRYVSIRHAGVVFQPNKELNGLSLGAVGRGTTIEFVEAFATADDGFEFFGGTVNTKYLISAFNDDDAFDVDEGYRGKNQFWFAIQEAGKKDNGGEWNGEPNGVSVGANPIANFEVYNATWIGAGTNTTGNRGLLIREYAAPKVYNSILTGFGTAAVSIDNKSAIHLTNGLLDIRDNLFWNFGGALGENGPAQLLFNDTTRSNLNVDPQLRNISRVVGGKLDPRPSAGSVANDSSRMAPANGFYSPVSYKGAFASVNWAADWTALGELGLISTAGAGVPVAAAVVVPNPDPTAPLLTLVRNGTEVSIALQSQAGVDYQLQSATSIGDGSAWNNVGQSQPGTGSSVSFPLPVSGTEDAFFRILAQ